MSQWVETGRGVTLDAKFIARLSDQLLLHEGRRLKPYVDTVGKTTIGIGRNLTDRGITAGEANILLFNDIDMVMRQLDDALPWWRDLGHVRMLVLADMAFNLGIKGLLEFKNTLKAMQRGDYELAARGMLRTGPRPSKWATQVGQRAHRLAEMMRTGEDRRK